MNVFVTYKMCEYTFADVQLRHVSSTCISMLPLQSYSFILSIIVIHDLCMFDTCCKHECLDANHSNVVF